MEKILIIGGNGFIGNFLANELSKTGYLPIVASRQRCSFCQHKQIEFNVLDRKTWKNLPQLEQVVNLAWYTVHPNFWNAPENIQYRIANSKLFEYLAEGSFLHAVIAGTCAEYLCEKNSQSTELGRSKLDYLNNIKQISNSSALKFNWARLFFVYGQGEPSTKLLTQIRNNEVELENIRDPQSIRDFVHVDMVSEQFQYLINNRTEGVNDVGSGYGLRVMDLLNKENIDKSMLKKYRASPTKSELIANTTWLKRFGIEIEPEKIMFKFREFIN